MGLIALFAAIFLFQSRSLAAQLRLSWSDNSDNEEGFEVQRWTPNTGFIAIAIVGGNVSAFTDSTVVPGSSYCYRVRAFNAEAISGYSNLGFATTPTTVRVSRFGSGAGSVLSSPPGIDCGNDCIEPYASGTVITLVPFPAEGSVFAGWSGDCTGTSSCTLTIDADHSVTATFRARNAYTLKVTLAGIGSGIVSSDPTGIKCPSGNCATSYDEGTEVQLSASPNPGYVFAGWSGACSGSKSSCAVTMDAAKSVTATFTK